MNHLSIVTPDRDDADVVAALTSIGRTTRTTIAVLDGACRAYSQHQSLDSYRSVKTAVQAVGAERKRLIGLLDRGEPWFRSRVGVERVDVRQVLEQEAKWIALLRCYEQCEATIDAAIDLTSQQALVA